MSAGLVHPPLTISVHLFRGLGEKANESMRNLSDVLVGARLLLGIVALSAVLTFFSVIMLTTA